MKFEEILSFNLVSVTNILWVAFDKKLREKGFSSGQIFVLVELWQNEGITQTDLARSLRLSNPTVCKMVNSLLNQGIVNLVKCKTDKRATNIFLTSYGKSLQESAYQVCKEFDVEVFEEFSETERLILSQLNDKLINSLLK